jgi:hypothetical protein
MTDEDMLYFAFQYKWEGFYLFIIILLVWGSKRVKGNKLNTRLHCTTKHQTENIYFQHSHFINVKFEVLVTITVNIIVFWDDIM